MRVGFDLSRVRVLQEDITKLARRLDIAVRGGWGKVAEARRAMGWKVADDGSEDVYLRQMNTAIVPDDGSEPTFLTPSKQENEA